MGKIIATWSVKVTLREPDGATFEAGEEAPDPVEVDAPTIDVLTEKLAAAAVDEFGGEWHVTAERTDI